jgi:hypothetical protein
MKSTSLGLTPRLPTADTARQRIVLRQQRTRQAPGTDFTGGGRDQRHPADPLGEDLRELCGEFHDHHAAERVPHQHQRALWRHCAQHGFEIASELLDRAVLLRRRARKPMSTMVVVHLANPRQGQRSEIPPLEMPAAARKTEAVHADHDQLGIPAVGGFDLVDR